MERPRSERTWHVRKIRLGEDDGEMDRLIASEMTPEERMGRVWALVVHLGSLRGEDYSQQRLQRSVTRVQRGRRLSSRKRAPCLRRSGERSYLSNWSCSDPDRCDDFHQRSTMGRGMAREHSLVLR